VFLDAPFPVTVGRLSGRDGTVADPHHADLRRYVEGQRVYFRSCRPWLRASRVVDNTDLERPRLLSKEEVSALSSERLGEAAGRSGGQRLGKI
jgi:uridine kinase